MFGKNPVSPIEHQNAGELLAVQEVFYTLQGEGPYSGVPAVFIRLAGCNLQCKMCDTPFDKTDNLLSVSQITKQVRSYPHHNLVVLTGGEPLRQNIVPLMYALSSHDIHVQVETAGTCWPPGLGIFNDRQLTIVCSPKTPKLHPKIVERCHHYKYVIQSGRTASDGLPCGSYFDGPQFNNPEYLPYRPAVDESRVVKPQVWVSPCDDYDAELNKANMRAATDSAMTHGYRLSSQVHKIVSLP